jgi:oxygen-dependent protoporphyrinogen oxidase
VSASSPKGGPRVVVVGASLAGLAAAWRLQQAGLAVALLERESAPGGRVRSEWREGFTCEAADPVLSTADRRLRAWIEELGLRDELLPLRPLVSAQVRRGRLAEIDARDRTGIGRIPGVGLPRAARLLRLGRLLRRFGAALDPEHPERAAPLDDRSLADFGRLYFGRGVLERWMQPSLTTRCLGEAGQTSRALFLRRLHAEDGTHLGLPRAGLGELPQAAAARLSVRYGVRVTRIEAGEPGKLRLGLRPQGGGGERVREAEGVVVATSAEEAARVAAPLLAPAERDLLGRVRYLPSVVLTVALRRPFHSHPLLVRVPHAEGSPLESVLLEHGVAGERVPVGRGLARLQATSAWSASHYDLPAETLEKELLDAFDRLWPGARGAVVFALLQRVPRAMPHFGVGHYRAIAHFERVQADQRARGRRLCFAGDYLTDPSCEGAVRSAERAAAALLRILA